jgi:D-alanine-D-alanine ligase
MKYRIGFTYDAKNDYKPGPGDLPDKFAEFDSEETISDIGRALATSGHEIIRIGHAKKLISEITSGKKYDLVFNICEGLDGRGRESQVPAILDLFGIPYSGSDALTMALTLDKTLAKKVIAWHGLKTANFISVESLEGLSPKKLNLRFPVIVKPSQEGTSKGLSKESLARNFTQMKKRAEWVLRNYRQPVLIEEFIVGYEFTIAVVGNEPPEVLPPVQVAINGETDLGENFYTQARVESPDVKYICPPEIDKELDKKIMNFALDCYKTLECRDFGRIDIRVDYNNEPYFLECNPLPNLGKVDVFPLVAKATGRTYEQLLAYILESAIKRNKL